MLSLATIVSFFGTSLLIAAAPGPDTLFILTQSLAYGPKVGILVSLGNVCALLVPTAATALGLGALITASPAAYGALKYVGAFYLLYLGIKSLLKKPAAEVDASAKPAEPSVGLALRGAIVSITNPHVSALFLAFIPQFINAEAGHVGAQVVQLGLLHMLSAFSVFVVIALASGLVRQKIAEKPQILRYIDRVTGVVFIGLALRLVLGA